MPNQGLLAIAFFEASAIFILLILYFLLVRAFPARFFRYWLAGWTLFMGYGASRLVYGWRGSLKPGLPTEELFFAATFLFILAVLEYAGRSPRSKGLWVLAAVGLAGIAAAGWAPGLPVVWHWGKAIFESVLYVWTGWWLWRFTERQRGYGAALLAAALLLRGLHGLDQADWSSQPFYLLRVSFNSFFEVTIGIGMAVLVLEAGLFRTEDLNEKLRRLTMITAAATQTFRVDDVLSEVLDHLVDSLGLSHGMVSLLDGEGEAAALVVRAALGFSEHFLEQSRRIPASEPWAKRILKQDVPFLAYKDVSDPEVQRWMESEHLAALVLLRLPGKEVALGVLAVGSTGPRVFQDDEINFLVNVANLLGLTIQNLWLFQQVAQAERQWTYTFDSIGDPILVHDLEFRLLRLNQVAAQRFGGNPASLAGHRVAELLRRGEARWVHCPYCEGAAGKGDTLDPNFGGYFLASNSDFHDPGGARLGTIHVLKNITDRKQAEGKYRELFANVQEGVFISTPEGRFVDFNETFQRMLGYESREELMEVDIAPRLYVNPGDREHLKKLLREHGAVSGFEFQMRRRDGETLTVSESSVATRDQTGAVVAIQGFVLDVSERQRVEQELRRRNRELMVLNSIAQTLSQSLALEDLLARALKQAVELFGVDLAGIYLFDETAGEVRRIAAVGFRSEYAESLPPVVVPRELLEQIRQVRPTFLSPMSLPLPAVFRDVQKKEGIEVSHAVVLWSKERILGALVVASRTLREFAPAELSLLAAVGNQIAATIDKSGLLEESRLAYENLRRAQEQLLQSEKMAAVGQLISGVAHELNNPLTAILGYAQLLASSPEVTPRGAEYVEKLYKQTQRTHRIVQNLLSFARPHQPERQPVRLNQIVDDTVTLREYDLKLNNVHVHRNLDPYLPPTSGDAHQLQQVFLNILNNAVDAILESSTRGEVWVRTWSASGRLFVEFTDSGPGLAEPLRVFDPFYTTKPVGKGTGLGLSICYGILKEHGGDIEARNAPPRGASFRISLPVLPVERIAEKERTPADELCICGSVLLVDDEEAVLDLEQEILSGRCHTIYTARDGREALKILGRENVDLVIADMKMPGEVSGTDLYHWIEAHRPGLSRRVVFAISNDPTEELRTEISKNGCAYVQKPFGVDEFLNGIRQVLVPAGSAPVRPS